MGKVNFSPLFYQTYKDIDTLLLLHISTIFPLCVSPLQSLTDLLWVFMYTLHPWSAHHTPHAVGNKFNYTDSAWTWADPTQKKKEKSRFSARGLWQPKWRVQEKWNATRTCTHTQMLTHNSSTFCQKVKLSLEQMRCSFRFWKRSFVWNSSHKKTITHISNPNPMQCYESDIKAHSKRLSPTPCSF